MWQPIETMPLETHGLVWGKPLRWRGVGGVTIGYRHEDYNGHKGLVTLDGRCGHVSRDVTHWMPLPEPPNA